MPIHHAIWKVGPEPQPLTSSSLTNENELEEMIVANPRLLSDEWMIIGRQENTGFGGRIDLLAMAPDASLVLIELKRDRTPREVVAQALDYASWVDKLSPGDIAAIYDRFAQGKSLAVDFQGRFGRPLDEDELNQNHQIIIVAASLDPSTERIVSYLSAHDIPLNVLFFQIFLHGEDKFISRAWLFDSVSEQVTTETRKREKEPWNDEFYASFGHSEERSWEDALEYGFICAGGGTWYTQTLRLLSPGDRVWVNIPRTGFVGVGRVTGQVQPFSTFTVRTPEGEAPVLDVATRATYLKEHQDDPILCEYFVPIDWLQTMPLNQAVTEIGFFGNQNTVCKPTTPVWRLTVDRLKEKFPRFND